jgi:thiosulfate/3-mercaptopyruvate sulfurtransferase
VRAIPLAFVIGLAAGLGGAAVAWADGHPLLVDVAGLAGRLADPRVRVVDMVTEPDAYRKGHLPGAVYLHVNDSRMAVPSGGYRLPTQDEAARLFGRLGIGRDTDVVVYDDAGGLHASRLFFTLEVFGHKRAAILDGGIQAWQRAGRPLTRDVPVVPAGSYRPVLLPERVASAEQLRARLKDPALAIVDARSPAEYAGRDVRAKRGGHVPGAVNLDWVEHLRPDGTFKSPAELRALYVSRGITPDKTVVTYCQTQHRASHSYFVLRLLGYPRVVGYDRSWAEWGNRDDLPIAR